MPIREVTTIEAVSGGPNQRTYIPSDLRVQHDYPFRAKQPIGLQVVETACGRQVVVMTPETIAVDEDATELVLERANSDRQTELADLEEVES